MEYLYLVLAIIAIPVVLAFPVTAIGYFLNQEKYNRIGSEDIFKDMIGHINILMVNSFIQVIILCIFIFMEIQKAFL